MGFSNYDRTSHKILANGITTIEFNGEHPNYYRVFNLGDVPLYCSTNNIPTKKLFDFKVEPNSAMSYAEPFPRDRIYVFNPNNVECEILLTKYLGDFDPVFNALSNAGIEIKGKVESDGVINAINAPLPSGTNTIGKVGLDDTTLQQMTKNQKDYSSVLSAIKQIVNVLRDTTSENLPDINNYMAELTPVIKRFEEYLNINNQKMYDNSDIIMQIYNVLNEIKNNGGGFFFDGYKSGDLIMLQKYSGGGWHYLYKIPNVEYFTNLKIHSVSTLKDSDLKTVKIGCLRQDGKCDVFDLLNMPSLDWIPTNEVYTDMVLYVNRNNAIQLDFKYSYKCCESDTEYKNTESTFTELNSEFISEDERLMGIKLSSVKDKNGNSYSGYIKLEIHSYGLIMPINLAIENGISDIVPISMDEIPPIMSLKVIDFDGSISGYKAIKEVSE